MFLESFLAGAAVTRFERPSGRPPEALARRVATAALEEAGLAPGELEATFVASAGGDAAGALGPGVLDALGAPAVPVLPVGGSDAGGVLAFQQAHRMVAAGYVDAALVLAADTPGHPEPRGALSRMAQGVGAHPVGHGEGAGEACDERRARFLAGYERAAWRRGAVPAPGLAELAAVVAKSARHARANPCARLRGLVSVEALLREAPLAGRLTRSMCAPGADGAAALVLVGPRLARRLALRLCVGVAASAGGGAGAGAFQRAARTAYEDAGVGPEDVDVIECHDVSAAAELAACEDLGLCAEGESGALVRAGATELGGTCPVNPSGGCLRRGHALAASGLAQLVELRAQLQGRAEGRQAEGALVALAQAAGGASNGGPAAACVTVLAR